MKTFLQLLRITLNLYKKSLAIYLKKIGSLHQAKRGYDDEFINHVSFTQADETLKTTVCYLLDI